MSDKRPPMVGSYELLLDFESADLSVRVFRLEPTAGAVDLHVHRHTNQTYVVLEGNAVISRDGLEDTLGPHQAATVEVGTVHGARASGGEAVLMNISVPPLRIDDQVPVAAEH